MNTVERIKSICKERKIAISTLEKECGFANGYIGQLRKGSMPDDRLRRVADFLELSTNYLMYGADVEFSQEMAFIDVKLSNLPIKTKEYALKLAALPKEKQEQIMGLIDMLEE
jgi:transcriptional regulator with XRE-family HTH domain